MHTLRLILNLPVFTRLTTLFNLKSISLGESESIPASPVKEALIKLADEWLDGTQNPDDITFVVLEKNDSVDTPKKLTGEKSESVPKVAQA